MGGGGGLAFRGDKNQLAPAGVVPAYPLPPQARSRDSFLRQRAVSAIIFHADDGGWGWGGKVLLFLPISLVSREIGTQETRAKLPDWSQPLFQILGPGWASGTPALTGVR